MSSVKLSLIVIYASATSAFAAENRDTVHDMATLIKLAENLAQSNYDDNARQVPQFLTQLGYDEYRDFQFKTDQALWHDEQLPFELTFFHAGYIYPKSVAMNAINLENSVTPIPFSSDLFAYGPQEDLIQRLPENLDFSGFHIWHRNQSGAMQGVGLFQGASYLRMVSSFSEYGLSARALSINTSNSEPEEFPDFSQFWFQHPKPNDTDFVFLGLLESPSITGAYRFELTPGTPVRLRVQAQLFARRDIEELGLTPFSTMFWYGENSAGRPADFRPEVHDSDGLQIQTENRYIWRPISNPPRTRSDIITGENLLSFGFSQRDRNFENYQDIEARYHLRPDAWVVPGKNMDNGSLHLLEIESPHEYSDNIALAWVPKNPLLSGETLVYEYELYFGETPAPKLASVVASRYGESLRGDGSIEFVIDFKGGTLDSLDEDSELTIISSIEGGELIWQNVRKNPFNDTWRMNLRVSPTDKAHGMRLRANLQQDNTTLSETWVYWWQS